MVGDVWKLFLVCLHLFGTILIVYCPGKPHQKLHQVFGRHPAVAWTADWIKPAFLGRLLSISDPERARWTTERSHDLLLHPEYAHDCPCPWQARVLAEITSDVWGVT